MYHQIKIDFIRSKEEHFMAEQFNYSSVLSPYIKRMLEIRKSMGIVDSRVRWILKEFDDFANSIGLQEPHITEEFVKRCGKAKQI